MATEMETTMISAHEMTHALADEQLDLVSGGANDISLLTLNKITCPTTTPPPGGGSGPSPGGGPTTSPPGGSGTKGLFPL